MAFALIASVASGAAATNTTANIDTTGADLIIAAVALYTANTSSYTLSESKGNGNPAQFSARVASPYKLQLNVWRPTVVGAGHNFTVTPAGGNNIYSGLAVQAWSGAAGVVGTDQFTNFDAVGTTIQPGSITPAASNALVATCLMHDAASTISINGGYTITGITYSAGVNMGCRLAYLVQGAAAATNPTWTNSTSGTMLAEIADFLQAVATGQPTRRRFSQDERNGLWLPSGIEGVRVA